MDKPIIGITMGDAAGIGPEIIVKALKESSLLDELNAVVIGDAKIMEKALKILSNCLKLKRITKIKEADFSKEIINVLDLDNLPEDIFATGKVDVRAGKAAVEQTKKAVEIALRGEIDAITSAPVNKEAMHLAGYDFAGQTELLAHLTNCKKYQMVLCIGYLRLFYVSNHISMKDAFNRIKKKIILSKIEGVNEALKDFGIENGRIAVAGFNPHAGENGLMGSEEKEEIIPAIQAAQMKGVNALGPFPADAVFVNARKGAYEAVLAMYHDQGNIAAKMMGAGTGVTVVVGLPVIRTSVAHGTAYDIAGKGIAKPESLISAINTAAEIARARGKAHKESDKE